MPKNVRSAAVVHYRAALAGEHGRFAFVSYGHAYSVDAVPVHRDDGRITAVLGIATPAARVPRRRRGVRAHRRAARALGGEG